MDRIQQLNYILNILCDLKTYDGQDTKTIDSIIDIVKFKIEH